MAEIRVRKMAEEIEAAERNSYHAAMQMARQMLRDIRELANGEALIVEGRTYLRLSLIEEYFAEETEG